MFLKKQVEGILPADFNWRHLYANWGFPSDILPLIKNLPENRNCVTNNKNDNPNINILMSENIRQKRLKILEYFDAYI